MNAKSQYLIQVLEKIGAPLLSSIVESSASTSEGMAADDAQRMAELLARTTQASLEIAGVISPVNATQDDAFRLALAALAAPVIADHYRYDKQVPGDSDIKKITAALQTVVTFADNFEAGIDHARTLQGLGNHTAALESSQIALHQVMAFTPVINAVSSFSFGMNEPKLISDIAGRLVGKSLAMSAEWFAGADETARRKSALDILKTLARIYAACHMAETARLQSAGAAAGGIETVWKNFDLRVALLEALASGLLDSSSISSSSRAPEAAAAPPPQSGANPLSGFAKKPPSETPPAKEAPPASSPTGASPLGIFAKKPTDQAPASPPPQAPEKSQSPPANPGTNPMGFFKPPAKKDGE